MADVSGVSALSCKSLKGGEVIDFTGAGAREIYGLLKGRLNNAIQRAYSKELDKNPSLRGEVALSFTFDTNGKIVKVEAEGSNLPKDFLIKARTIAASNFCNVTLKGVDLGGIRIGFILKPESA